MEKHSIPSYRLSPPSSANLFQKKKLLLGSGQKRQIGNYSQDKKGSSIQADFTPSKLPMDGGNHGVGIKTLKRMEEMKYRNLEALKLKYGPKVESNKILFPSVESNVRINDENQSSDHEEYEEMIQDYYNQKGRQQMKLSEGRSRLVSSKYQRAESNYSQNVRFTTKNNISIDVANQLSHRSVKENKILPTHLAFKALRNGQHMSSDVQPRSKVDLKNLSQIQAQAGDSFKFPQLQGHADRSNSNYSMNQRLVSGYGVGFGKIGAGGSDLYFRYLEQLKKANDLREKGKKIKQDLKIKEGQIIEAILIDSKLARPKIRLKLDEKQPVNKHAYLDYSKKKAKQENRAQELERQFHSNQLRNSEGNKYILSNLRKLDEDAEKAERAASHLKKPFNHKRSAELSEKEKYMESIRAKFSFLEGAST